MSKQIEQFRIVTTVGRDYSEDAASKAIGQVLDWAGEGLKKPLPEAAWDFGPFKHFAENGNCNAVRILGDERDIWAIRVDRSDGAAARGSIRSTEAVVQRYVGKRTILTVRQLAEWNPRIEAASPEIPAFVHAVNAKIGLYSQWVRLESEPWIISAEDEFQQLIAMLVDSTRKWPVLALSVPEFAPTPFTPLLDAKALARATTGLAVVAVLPHEYCWELTNRFGKDLSVYQGAARIYRPEFDESADKWTHELELVQRVESPEGKARIVAKLRRAAAQVSLDRYRLGADLLEFAAIRKKASELARPVPEPTPERQAEPSIPSAPAVPADPAETERSPEPEVAASVAARTAASAQPTAPIPAVPAPAPPEPPPTAAVEPTPRPAGIAQRILAILGSIFPRGAKFRAAEEALASSRREIEDLRSKLKESEEFGNLASDELKRAETRAKEAEAELARAKAQVKELADRLGQLGADDALPAAWGQFAEWCERELVGKVMLSQQAKREIKKAKYKDVATAAQGLLWLGGEYRDQRVTGGEGTVRGLNSIGLFNEPCGGSSFSITWGGQRAEVKWHLKSGGSTHDPTRCLRIYYFWDDKNEQVVIASMPAHHPRHGEMRRSFEISSVREPTRREECK